MTSEIHKQANEIVEKYCHDKLQSGAMRLSNPNIGCTNLNCVKLQIDDFNSWVDWVAGPGDSDEMEHLRRKLYFRLEKHGDVYQVKQGEQEDDIEDRFDDTSF